MLHTLLTVYQPVARALCVLVCAGRHRTETVPLRTIIAHLVNDKHLHFSVLRLCLALAIFALLCTVSRELCKNQGARKSSPGLVECLNTFEQDTWFRVPCIGTFLVFFLFFFCIRTILLMLSILKRDHEHKQQQQQSGTRMQTKEFISLM
jgi:hypothetical protein